MKKDDDTPTELTLSYINNFIEKINKNELDIKFIPCSSCGKEYLPSYGEFFCECDECWFKRFPKEQIKDFYKSFFE